MSRDVSSEPPKDIATNATESVPVVTAPQPAPASAETASYLNVANPGNPAESLQGDANNNNNNNQQQQQLPPPAPHPHASHSIYHPYPPPPLAAYTAGPYSAAVGNPPIAGPPYHPHHAPPGSRPPQQQQGPISTSHAHSSQQQQQSNSQGPPPPGPQTPIVPPHAPNGQANHVHILNHSGVPSHNYEREDKRSYHHPMPVRSHSHPSELDYRGHPHHPPPPPPPPAGAYSAPPPPSSHYAPPPPDDRRWMGPEGSVVGHPPPPPPHHGRNPYAGYDSQRYGKPHAPQSFPPPPPPPPVGPGQHMSYRYPHPVYPSNAPATNGRGDETSRGGHGHHPQQAQQQAASTASANNNGNNTSAAEPFNDVDGREGATSPSQIELSHRDEVTNMGCTCKKTKCLKLYCQCFAVKIFCGSNCRCLVCFNTTKHEKQRKDAMRSILSRNPTAFDTKFSKTKERKTKEQQLVLAHKLGCKCRKSACMKKYCECYAGNVKCSPNCRCIGCKNIPSSFAPGKPGDNAAAMRDGGMPVRSYEIPVVAHSVGGRTGREPWMMNAAQNLAFLKHASPTAEKKRVTAIQDTADVACIPSLAAASSDTSPGDRTVETAKPVEPPKESEEPNGSAVNSLLMAAMAMTEFQSQKAEENNSSSGAQEKKVGVDAAAENLKPAARKGLRPSPKRKSSERGSPEGTLGDFAEKSGIKQDSEPQYTAISGEGDTGEFADGDVPSSPLDPRDLKRTRLGSIRKKMEWEKGSGGQNSSPGASSKENNATLHETPDQKTTLDILTPVSARCIDFRRMNVNEKKEESALD